MEHNRLGNKLSALAIATRAIKLLDQEIFQRIVVCPFERIKKISRTHLLWLDSCYSVQLNNRISYQ